MDCEAEAQGGRTLFPAAAAPSPTLKDQASPSTDRRANPQAFAEAKGVADEAMDARAHVQPDAGEGPQGVPCGRCACINMTSEGLHTPSTKDWEDEANKRLTALPRVQNFAMEGVATPLRYVVTLLECRNFRLVCPFMPTMADEPVLMALFALQPRQVAQGAAQALEARSPGVDVPVQALQLTLLLNIVPPTAEDNPHWDRGAFAVALPQQSAVKF